MFERVGVGWRPGTPIQITAGGDAGDDDKSPEQPQRRRLDIDQGKRCRNDNPTRKRHNSVDGCRKLQPVFHVSGRNETAGNVTLPLTHNFSSRSSFDQCLWHLPEPSPIPIRWGPQNVVAVFDTSGDSAHSSLVSRLSLVTKPHVRVCSGTLFLVERKSERGSEQAAQNCIQNTFSETFQFSLTSRTILWANIVPKR